MLPWLTAEMLDELFHHLGLTLLEILQRTGLGFDGAPRICLAQRILGAAHLASGLIELLRDAAQQIIEALVELLKLLLQFTLLIGPALAVGRGLSGGKLLG